MTLLENAELFAKLKHAGKLKKSGTTYSNHLENVVSRLKSLGVIDEEEAESKVYEEVGFDPGEMELVDVNFDI